MARAMRLDVSRAACLCLTLLLNPAAALANGTDESGTAKHVFLVTDIVELAHQYENGESLPKNYQRALALYCQAARNGDARAFFALGWMYLNGRGVKREDARAATWLRKAAKQGVPQATNLLGILPDVPQSATDGCSSNEVRAAALTAPPVQIRVLIEQSARDVGVDPKLLQSVMSIESGFDPRAVSLKGAVGLMQLMPSTAERYGVRDSFDERENVYGGASYLRDLLYMFGGDLTLALAAYNAGEGAVASHHGVPPFRETIDYVAAVKRLCSCGN